MHDYDEEADVSSPFVELVEPLRGEAEVGALDLGESPFADAPEGLERQVAAAPRVTTIGFEFDVHYGFLTTAPPIGSVVTDHSDAADGFRVKRDGPRLEIATKPFTVDDAGLREMNETIRRILAFARDLKRGCRSAAPASSPVPNFSGRPRFFTLPRAASGGIPRIARLPFRGRFHPSNCSVWAAPQATLTVRLDRIGALVSVIRRSEGKAPGIALTGGGGARMGVRSVALYRARRSVDQLRRRLVSRRPRLVLSDGREVNATSFTEPLRGLLILLASYLWTSELRYHFADPKPRDYEPFAKAYLPVNVKAPFGEVFQKLLTDEEKLFFREVFAEGEDARRRFFGLAGRGAAPGDGSRKLFPPGPLEGGRSSVHARQEAEYGAVPTWNDLLDYTVDPAHKWSDKLLVPLSSKIGIDKTSPRVALELRRIGFNAVFDRQWRGMMRRIFAIAKRLDR